MPLEQLLAYLEDRSQDELGPTQTVGPDRFPLLESSELRGEHELISQVLATPPPYAYGHPMPPLSPSLNGDRSHRTRCYLALLERNFAYDAGLRGVAEDHPALDNFFGYGVASGFLTHLLRAGVDEDLVVLPTLRWMAAHRSLYHQAPLLEELLGRFEATPPPNPSEARDRWIDIGCGLIDGQVYERLEGIADRIDGVVGGDSWRTILPGEAWTDQILADLDALPTDRRAAWRELLRHCQTAKSSKPSAKWRKTGTSLLEAVSVEEFRERVPAWFEQLDRGRTRPVLCSVWENTDARQTVHDLNANMARGLLWLAAPIATPDLCRSFTRVALSAYRKIRGVGPRAVKVGNAAVNALGEVANLDAVGQLAVLKVRVKFGTAQKGIEKALVKTAAAVGLPREELEEMAVPAYGLTSVGRREEPLGEFVAELTVGSPKSQLAWRKPDGKQQKSVPAAVKKEWAEDLKELKQAIKDIDRMLPAQAARLERLYLQPRQWPYSTWRERYLDHPLVGVLARRLIWRFDGIPQPVSGCYHAEALVGRDHAPLGEELERANVSLWHPLSPDIAEEEILEWREWLIDHQIRQPFKQAHREIYLLTDAERSTEVYSNRFAAHVLKQHQYNALCAARGWKNQLRLMVDDDYAATHVELPHWSLRAEYWVEGIGQEYGEDTTEAGAYLYLATDQVRFYRDDAAMSYAHACGGGFTSDGTDRAENRPRPLTEIPPLVLSEVLRDVDLFVGVSSVGNDPNWSDGGPEGRYRDYWQSISFGALNETAATRKAVLEQLVPRLQIADRCSFSDRFLVVRGDVRTYKIHLGSGNILMEPSDQYLCIVPDRPTTTRGDKVFLPFEGDRTLSLIVSKALLLAQDTKITDSTILSQIGRP